MLSLLPLRSVGIILDILKYFVPVLLIQCDLYKRVSIWTKPSVLLVEREYKPIPLILLIVAA